MEITGAEIVVRCLHEENVEHIFGYPGGAVLYIYDEIYKQKKFKHILVRHEQAAVQPGRYPRPPSAWTPSRSATPSASRAPSSSTTSS